MHINKQCTSDCRRDGCPEEDICAHCGENKWVNPEKHIVEVADFLQKKIRELQELLKKS